MNTIETLKQNLEQHIPTVDALEFRSAMAAANAVFNGKVPLPCWFKIGNSGFKVTDENKDVFHLGVMFATDEAWDDKD